MGHAEALSRTSKQAFAPFPVPLRRGRGWEGVKGVLENIMAVSGGDEFNVICIAETVA